MNVLVTIPFSHYCEKARWALERCGVDFVEQGHLPIFHYPASRRAGGGRTVPVLRAGEQTFADSTEIAAWADSHAPGALISEGALPLEDDFDRQLGPATRRWGYSQLLPNRAGDALLVRDVPRWEARLLPFVRPLAVRMLKRGLNVTPDGVERSRKKIEEVFARVADRLADGRRYLCGDRFTIADLTFASLCSPILLPPELPNLAAAVPLLPPAGRAELDAWRASVPGQFALRMYRDERAVHGTQ